LVVLTVGSDVARAETARGGLLEAQHLGPTDDTPQRQHALTHDHLDRLDEAFTTYHPVATRKGLHGRLGTDADHALRERSNARAQLVSDHFLQHSLLTHLFFGGGRQLGFVFLFEFDQQLLLKAEIVPIS